MQWQLVVVGFGVLDGVDGMDVVVLVLVSVDDVDNGVGVEVVVMRLGCLVSRCSIGMFGLVMLCIWMLFWFSISQVFMVILSVINSMNRRCRNIDIFQVGFGVVQWFVVEGIVMWFYMFSLCSMLLVNSLLGWLISECRLVVLLLLNSSCGVLLSCGVICVVNCFISVVQVFQQFEVIVLVVLFVSVVIILVCLGCMCMVVFSSDCCINCGLGVMMLFRWLLLLVSVFSVSVVFMFISIYGEWFLVCVVIMVRK